MSTRRELVIETMDDILVDVRKMSSGEFETTGKHSFAEIVRHLASTHDMVTGKIKPPALPWYMRLAMPFMRSSILNGPVRPGFNLPAKLEAFFWPSSPIELTDAIEQLAASIENYKSVGPLDVHPIFGPAKREQVDRMVLAHAAMHLSFVRQV